MLLAAGSPIRRKRVRLARRPVTASRAAEERVLRYRRDMRPAVLSTMHPLGSGGGSYCIQVYVVTNPRVPGSKDDLILVY
jgi:hypothetical protein